MDKKTEALKLALEALEDVRGGQNYDCDTDRCDEAITAISEALADHTEQHLEMVEQPAQQDPVQETSMSKMLWCDLKTDAQRSNWLLLGRGYETGVVAKAIQNDLAMAYHKLASIVQPAQHEKPVAYSYTSRITGAQGFSHHPMPRFIDADLWEIKPLYTSQPASKPWVGLTDEDTRKINSEVWGYVSADHTRMWDYARVIEAKLKEKNA